MDTQKKILPSSKNINEAIDNIEGKIVFTNGCFDLLHPGHVMLLERAKSHGDFLIVGINTDESVRRLKGESRPVNDLSTRTIMVAALESVDMVIPFDEDTPYELVKMIEPDIIVKGGDYSPEEVVGSDIVISKGGEVIIIDILEGYSTTNILKKLKG